MGSIGTFWGSDEGGSYWGSGPRQLMLLACEDYSQFRVFGYSGRQGNF